MMVLKKPFFKSSVLFCFINWFSRKLENSNDPRIINVASNAHKRYKLDINDLENRNNYNGWKAYCRSKLLNIFLLIHLKKK